MPIDLILENARILTLDPGLLLARWVAIKGDRIAAVGSDSPPPGTRGARRIDCQGMTLVPGFNDAHLHLLALASSLRGVDCYPGQVSSIAEIVKAIKGRAAHTSPGQTIRAYGYDEFYLAERRHPNRWGLDAATTDHPVRLDHRTGHASVVNSPALSLLAIGRDTPDPVQGVIDREENTGEPTGLLYEMADRLRPLGEAGHAGEEFAEGVREANRLLLSRGITSVQEATPANNLARWHLFDRLKREGHLTPRISMMMGAPYLDQFILSGLVLDDDLDLRLGAVKVMLSFTTGSLYPPQEELSELVDRAHRGGFQMAIHAVEHEAVVAAAEALAGAQRAWPRTGARHRIEHCCECPPDLAEKIASSGSMAVTQPSFTHLYGARYLSQTLQELAPHLYPLKALCQAGVPLAAGSDAPVARPDPLLSIHAAVTRRTVDGVGFNVEQALSPYEALRMHTVGGAYASFEEGHKGTIEVGKLADLALLTDDPTQVEHEAIKDIGVVLTVVGGRVAWER